MSLQTLRVNGVKLLQLSFSMLNGVCKEIKWPEGTALPKLAELRNEIKLCHPKSRPSNYNKNKCINILMKLPEIYYNEDFHDVNPINTSVTLSASISARAAAPIKKNIASQETLHD